MIPLFSKQASQAFDLTAHVAKRERDVCWFLETAPASFDIVGWVNAVTARGDVRSYFARNVLRIVGGR